MRRREFIALVGSAAATWPFTAHGQQPEGKRRIGVLISVAESDPEGQRWVRALLEGLRTLGWKRGTNLEVDIRYGDSNSTRIEMIAKELVVTRPDMLEVLSTPGTAAVLKETRTIPVVFSNVSDPVGAGFVQSLPHPGGNATGFITIEASMGGKWLQLLKEVAPRVTRATMLFSPATAAPQADYYRRAVEAAAPALAITTKSAPVSDIAALEAEIIATAQDRYAGLIVLPDTFTLKYRDPIVSLANRTNIPTVYPFSPFAVAGGLLSYGIDLSDLQRRAAIYVDRILHGTKPFDLPVQAPTKFELVINLKTAKAIGVTVPQDLLVAADNVIE
jgi:putative tryptophan/tyrosine transport system substrate-binding protein